jgi:putative ATPase
MTKNLSLFIKESSPKRAAYSPKTLSELLRPKEWQDFVGLEDIKGELISRLRDNKGRPPSLIFWGPPGSGKTTLAKLLGRNSNLRFVEFSAVLGGIKEVREIIDEAENYPEPTILFIDEIHRFNKAQQDAFLPHVEAGTIILFGATTENPSFYVTQALLSRARVVVVPKLSEHSLKEILQRAQAKANLGINNEAAQYIIKFSSGDARRLINLMESLAEVHVEGELTLETLKTILGDRGFSFYDREGEEHYNIASAFIKSLRGSDADGVLYWGFRMLEAGEDPRFLIRRMIIFASEDIGNADPRALPMATATADAFDRVGLPEGRIPIAQCITFLATAPKSNRSYVAMHAAIDAVKNHPSAPVPLHLRNAPTKLMKELNYGSEYVYPHDSAQGYVRDMQYLPEEIGVVSFYEPKESGYEKNIMERLKALKAQE